MIARVYLLPLLGDRPLDGISTERVQQLKATLTTRAPKTVNNVLTVLNTVLKRAVEWGLTERMPCTVRLLPVPPARAIQELAGHADLRTTQRYMHLSPAALDAAIRLLELPSVRVSFGDMLETATESLTKSSR